MVSAVVGKWVCFPLAALCDSLLGVRTINDVQKKINRQELHFRAETNKSVIEENVAVVGLLAISKYMLYDIKVLIFFTAPVS